MKHKAKSSSSSAATKGKSNGKGKDKPVGSSSSSEPIDLKDCPLRLPEFAEIDHAKVLPRYSSVLRRNEQDGIGLEDIDALQLELEALLSATVVRKMTLKEEIKILSNVEKYRGQGKSYKRAPGSPGKRVIPGKDSRSAKKLKSFHGIPADTTKVIGLPKLKTEANVPAFDPLANEQIRPVAENSRPALPKNETPNRFWAFVEPYCAPITPDDILLLEDLIRSHNDTSEYFKSPKLGQHYAQRWAKEDLENERVKGSGNPDANDRQDSGTSKLLRKAGESVNSDDSPFGELTQRLVAGLLEENIMTPIEETLELGGKKGAESSETNGDKSDLIKSLNIRNGEALEARVMKELEEQGLFDPNDEDGAAVEPAKDNDEVFEELLRCQAELKSVSTHNLAQLRRLLKAAKEEMVRQELRNKLQAADEHVMEAYKKISTARSLKKPPSKKDREQAWKALKEREIILKNLESV